MATAVMLSTSPSSAPAMAFRRLLPSATALLSFSLQPLQTTPLLTRRISYPAPTTRPQFLFLYQKSHPFSSIPPIQALLELQDDVVEGTHEDTDADGIEELERGTVSVTSEFAMESRKMHSKLQSLTVKEKKELASYAHSLGDKLKSQQVGKSGITDSVVTSLVEILEKHELLKVKVHATCPGELEDVLGQLEEATGSVVVGQIGRTVILYRPSLSKLKAEEKKKLAQRALLKKQMMKKPAEARRQGTGIVGRSSNRGRRGSSRFSGRG